MPRRCFKALGFDAAVCLFVGSLILCMTDTSLEKKNVNDQPNFSAHFVAQLYQHVMIQHYPENALLRCRSAGFSGLLLGGEPWGARSACLLSEALPYRLSRLIQTGSGCTNRPRGCIGQPKSQLINHDWGFRRICDRTEPRRQISIHFSRWLANHESKFYAYSETENGLPVQSTRARAMPWATSWKCFSSI